MVRVFQLTSLGALLALLAILFDPTAPDAHAQYFGRNKVEYESFDFRVLKTEHFDIYYYAEEREAAEQAARMAERWYARLAQILDHGLRGKQPLILYSSHPDFEQTTAIPGEIGEATGGVTQVIKRRIVLPLAGPLSETDHVIGHELVHAFQFDITGADGTGTLFAAPAAVQLPLWFIEGMAEYLSLGPVDANTAMWMRDAALNGEFPAVDELSDPRYFPYRYGQALWAYIAGRWGDERVGEILKVAGQLGDASAALTQVLEIPLDSLSARWRQATASELEPLRAVTHRPEHYGPIVLGGERGGGQYNLAPTISPDGKHLVFLSQRDPFSMDMYLADVETGEVERKIVSTAVDPHFESLGFINSTGGWSPDGRRFVFPAVSAGRPVLELMDIARGKVEREIPVPQVEEICSLSWSPDGRRVAFSANAGGLLDLFQLDLESGQVERLTEDAYAELQPAWSPTGDRIVFATDRYTTDLSHLAYRGYDLALLDVPSRTIESLETFPGARNIDPQWSPDGASVYFISDRDGISDLYRLELPTGHLFRITRLATGVSGITGLSPAISVAKESGRLAYTAYEAGGYAVYRIDASLDLAGVPPAEEVASSVKPDVLPPQDRLADLVLEAQRHPNQGLPNDTSFASSPYHSGLSLDYVAPPSLALGTGRFGTLIGGGTALYFSDMLGSRTLATLLQVNGGLKDIAALVGYANSRSRWNWGGSASQSPFVTGAFSQQLAEADGQTVVVDRSYLFHQINRQLAASVEYPFNRARRVELAGGYTNISFSSELETRVFSASGQLLDRNKTDVPSPGALNLGEASAALVYDNALNGPTAPILGQRYRLELSGTAGTLNLASTLVDYRRYVMPVWHVTLAGRLLHYGRWGGDAQDGRITPLFVGYQPLVRGYNTGSFEAQECQPNARSLCPAFDRLFGSRILLGNLEARVPVLGPLGLLKARAFPPLDLAAFYDAGVAWWGTSGALAARGIGRVSTDPGDPVSSFGAALRMNLYGFAVLELDLVHPNDRPGKGWYVEFGLTPGF